MAEIQNEMLQLGVYSLVVRGEGQDLLMSRDVHDFIEVKGLEDLLKQFILDLDNYFNFIYDNNVLGFLDAIQDKLKIDLHQLKSNMEENISQMRMAESDDIMIFYLVITKTLEGLRQHIFDDLGWNLIKNKYIELNGKALSSKLEKKIKSFDDTEDSKEISFLYNLIFIDYLAQIYKFKDISIRSKTLIQKKLKLLFAKLK